MNRLNCHKDTILFKISVDPNCFPCREFSFTLQDDIYIRYQSFNNQEEMEKAIQQKCPFKIDIGAVFNKRYYETI